MLDAGSVGNGKPSPDVAILAQHRYSMGKSSRLIYPLESKCGRARYMLLQMLAVSIICSKLKGIQDR